jgi:hypothetical protein
MKLSLLSPSGGANMPACRPRLSSKRIAQCVPSQNGLFFDPPQRHSA